MALARLGKTKIVCTLGPASSDVPMLVRLIKAGMDVARLNFSHGTREEHHSALMNIREASQKTGQTITVLQDLQGPKIRIGNLQTPFVELLAGNEVVIATEGGSGTAERLTTSFLNLPKDVSEGDTILLDDGKLRLRVLATNEHEVRCLVIIGGKLSPHKGINLPGVAVSAPSFTAKDLDDLAFGLAQDIDYVALSFVRTADDIRQLRQEIDRRRDPSSPAVGIIAKIEKPQAINDLDAIIAEADGVMVARGDLGVELPPEDVPMLQKKIIRRCNAAGKPVIVATQMLESMINSPTPTRAETSDVANAVVDGCDAVMLSGETSVGSYPAEAVAIMNRIVVKVESERSGVTGTIPVPRDAVENRHDALARAACVLADQLKAAAIVTLTYSGQTARVLSRYRPDPPIIGMTLAPKTLRMLNLFWGVRGVVIENLGADSDAALQQIQEKLLQEGLVQRGDSVVLLAGQPMFARGSTNFIKVERIG
ncbi:MAG: pyruvate kinase [Bacteroidota bacterium]